MRRSCLPADQLSDFRTQVSASAKREEFVRLARMVGHNINTPVLSLESVDTTGMDEKSRAVYRSALTDIKDLVNNLRSDAAAVKSDEVVTQSEIAMGAGLAEVETSVRGEAPLTVEHLSGLAEMAVSERRVQKDTPYRIEFESDQETFKSFARVARTEFKCILSNLMNNAIQALSSAARESGTITVHLSEAGAMVRVTVRDDGPAFQRMYYRDSASAV